MDRTAREYTATADDVGRLNNAVSEGDTLTMIPVGENPDAGTVTGVVFLPDGRTFVATVDTTADTPAADEPAPADPNSTEQNGSSPA